MTVACPAQTTAASAAAAHFAPAPPPTAVQPATPSTPSPSTAALPLAHPQTTNRKFKAKRARGMWEAGETDEEWLTFSRRELGLVELVAGESSLEAWFGAWFESS